MPKANGRRAEKSPDSLEWQFAFARPVTRPTKGLVLEFPVPKVEPLPGAHSGTVKNNWGTNPAAHDSNEQELRILEGDCRTLAPKLGKFDFIFADPPFNIGQEYNEYGDNMARDEYINFSIDWLHACMEAVQPDGVVCLHGGDDLVCIYLPVMEGKMERIAWINWHYRFGQCGRGNWIDARTHCLVYRPIQSEHTWNPEAVLVESDRSSVYGDKRVHDTERGGKRLPGTVWGIPSDGPYWGRVQGNSQERRPNHPNQLPLVYIARLLLAYTNKDSRVLDPFCGSGTTIAACKELGRSCVTIDISGSSVKSATERITDEKCRAVTRSRLELFGDVLV